MSTNPVSEAGRPLHILFLIDELEALHGGSEEQVLQLIKLLVSSGEDVELAILRGTEWLTEADAGCRVHFFHLNSVMTPSGLWGLLKLARWMRAMRFDAIQTMFWEANLIGPPLAKLAGVPLVLGSRRNLNYWMSGRTAFLQSISNRFATRLVANSQAVKKVVARQERTRESKVDVIYNGIDCTHFVQVPELRVKTRSEYGIPSEAILVGCVSAFRPVKGLDVLVRAAAASEQRRSATYFMFVGDGPTLPEIRQLACELGVSNYIVFAGAHKDVVPFLSAFDVGVLPSHSEGFSNSLLEYMSAGMPVIATDVGGNPEMLEDTGLIVPANDPQAIADSLSILISDAALRERLGLAAQARVREKFNLQKAQVDVHRYYTDLCNKHWDRSSTPVRATD